MKLTTDMQLEFRCWLEQNGAVIIPIKLLSDWIRFKSNGDEHCISMTKNGNLAYKGFAHQCVDRFLKGKSVNMAEKIYGGWKQKAKNDLLLRDGFNCFYCNQWMLTDDITLEHLIAKAFGGTDDYKNLVLAHGKCNLLAGNLEIIEKIRLRDKLTKEAIDQRSKYWLEQNMNDTKLPNYKLVPIF